LLQFFSRPTEIKTEGTRMPVLTDQEIQQALGSLKEWERNGKALQRVFRLPDFKATLQFVNKVADADEQANRHRHPLQHGDDGSDLA
jgi:pterin-4a-carbinolamine dehydratase